MDEEENEKKVCYETSLMFIEIEMNNLWLFLNDTIMLRNVWKITTELNILYKYVFVTYCKGKTLTVMKKLNLEKSVLSLINNETMNDNLIHGR